MISAELSPLLPKLLSLSPADKLLAIEALWESVPHETAPAGVAPWKLQVLEASRAQYLAHPETAVSWEVLKNEDPGIALADTPG